MNSKLESAAARLRKGGFIVLYDGAAREGEADLVFHASFASAVRIARLRRDAGGLICLATGRTIADRIGLPFFTDLLAGLKPVLSGMRCKKTAYGDKPAFSLPINHKRVYTGITDNDRALTIRRFASLAGREKGLRRDFICNFYAPGHVFLLIGRGLKNRRGHTELSLELAENAGLSPAMVLCEMLDFGKALSRKKAAAYARRHGFLFLEGREVI